MAKYKRMASPRKVTFEMVMRVHRLVFKQALRIGRLEGRVVALENRADDKVVDAYGKTLPHEPHFYPHTREFKRRQGP